MKIRRKNNGFTLPELMTVVVIIGILTATAIPNYQQYIIQSKLSESYTIIGSIQKNETTFFYENKEFYDLGPNPLNLNQPMLVGTDSEWAKIGYPAPVGSSTYFTYKARAGKIDSSGTQLATSTLNGNAFSLITTASLANATYTAPAAACNSGSLRATNLGAVSQNSYDWVAIVAVGDLKNNRDTVCTVVAQLIDVPGNDSPKSRGGFIILNPGN